MKRAKFFIYSFVIVLVSTFNSFTQDKPIPAQITRKLGEGEFLINKGRMDGLESSDKVSVLDKKGNIKAVMDIEKLDDYSAVVKGKEAASVKVGDAVMTKSLEATRVGKELKLEAFIEIKTKPLPDGHIPYTIRYDPAIPEKFASEFTDKMRTMYLAYKKAFNITPTSGYNKDFSGTIILYKDRNDFLANNADLPFHSVAAFFNPTHNNLEGYYEKDNLDVMTANFYHEGVHHFLYNIYPSIDIPTWYNEGMAQYLSGLNQIFDIKMQTAGDIVAESNLYVLASASSKNKRIPLNRLVYMSQKEFYKEVDIKEVGIGRVDVTYAEAWAICDQLHADGKKVTADIDKLPQLIKNGERLDIIYDKLMPKELAQAVEGPLKDYGYWHAKGDDRYQKKDYKGTIENYTLALAQRQCRLGYIARGKAKEDMGDYKGAIDDYNRAMKLREDYQTYLARGCARKKLKDYRGAIEDLEKSIALKPNPYAFGWLAGVKANMGDYKGAIEACDKALKIQPHHIIYYNRGLAKYYKKDYDGAIEDFEEAKKLDTDGELEEETTEMIRNAKECKHYKRD